MHLKALAESIFGQKSFLNKELLSNCWASSLKETSIKMFNELGVHCLHTYHHSQASYVCRGFREPEEPAVFEPMAAFLDGPPKPP